ncbi:MAG: DNA polymerase III subunit beta [Clostridiales bacterium]|nr:DNA polymerase III subunit beta [Clostridiales bacterium]
MKIIFEKSSLIAAVTPAMNATSNNNTITAVEGLLFETEGIGSCRITAYDTEKGIRTSVNAQVIKEGSYIINAQKFYQIIRNMPTDEITVTVNERMNVKIESGRSYFELHALPGEDFPALPDLTGGVGFKITQGQLKKFIGQTLFAIAQRDQRPIFTGMYFKIKGNELTVVTCDNYRLAKCSRKCDIEADTDNSGLDMSFIVPGKTVSELYRMIDGDEPISITLSNRHVIFRWGEIVFFSRLIDGEFLDYERAIPKSPNVFVKISREELEGALERASLIVDDKATGVWRGYIKCSFEGDRLIITSDSVSGSIYDEVPIEKKGADMEIGFNCRYLLDAVKAADTEKLLISLTTPPPFVGISITDGDADEAESSDFFFFVLPNNRMKQ